MKVARPSSAGSLDLPQLSRCGKAIQCIFLCVPTLVRLAAPVIPGGAGVVVAVDALAAEGTRGFVYVELQQGLNRLAKLLADVRFVFDEGKTDDEEFKELVIRNLVQPLGKLLLRFDLNVTRSKGVKLETVAKVLDIAALRKVNKKLLALVEDERKIPSKQFETVHRFSNLTIQRIQGLIKYALEENPAGSCFTSCCFSARKMKKQ